MDKTFLNILQEKLYSYKASSSPVHDLKKEKNPRPKSKCYNTATTCSNRCAVAPWIRESRQLNRVALTGSVCLQMDTPRVLSSWGGSSLSQATSQATCKDFTKHGSLTSKTWFLCTINCANGLDKILTGRVICWPQSNPAWPTHSNFNTAACWNWKHCLWVYGSIPALQQKYLMKIKGHLVSHLANRPYFKTYLILDIQRIIFPKNPTKYLWEQIKITEAYAYTTCLWVGVTTREVRPQKFQSSVARVIWYPASSFIMSSGILPLSSLTTHWVTFSIYTWCIKRVPLCSNSSKAFQRVRKHRSWTKSSLNKIKVNGKFPRVPGRDQLNHMSILFLKNRVVIKYDMEVITFSPKHLKTWLEFFLPNAIASKMTASHLDKLARTQKRAHQSSCTNTEILIVHGKNISILSTAKISLGKLWQATRNCSVYHISVYYVLGTSF